MSLIDKIKAIKDKFLGEPAPAPAPIVPIAATSKSYKTAAGVELIVTQAGEVVAVGDTVMTGGLPAVGEHTMEDGSVWVIDATGKIAEIKPAPAVTQDLSIPAPVPAPAPAPQQMAEIAPTPEALRLIAQAFATGTPEDRIANLEAAFKALMEYSFGYELSKEKALLIYKEANMPTEEKLSKHTEVLNELFTVVEEIAKTPTADPKTISESKKEKFEKVDAKYSRLERIANHLASNKGKVLQ